MDSCMTGPESTQERLRRVIVRSLGLTPEAVPDDLEFRTEPRWDSVAHLQLILDLEEEFGVTIANDDVLQMTSVRSVMDVLRRLGV